MKLLMTADAVGGVWQYSLDLIRGLTEQGIEVLLAVMGPPPSPGQRANAAEIAGLQLCESGFALEWMQDPWREVDQATSWLLKLAHEFGADVLHFNGYAQAAADWGRPVVVVAHSCVSSWWRAVRGEAPGVEWNQYRQRIAAGLRASTAIVSPSAYMSRTIYNEYGVDQERIHTIHNFSRAARYEQGRKRNVCLAAGRLWDAAKNLSVLNLAADESEWPIEIAGPAIDPQTSASIPSRLTILGTLPHSALLEKMRAAAVFVHPALYEPFGLAVLEAARSRCCLVLSDIEPMREFWDGAACFVDPRDPQAWSAALQQVIRSQVQREDLGARALARSARFSALETVSQYVALYQSLVRSKDCHGVAA